MLESLSLTNFVLYGLDPSLAGQLSDAVSPSGRSYPAAGSTSDCLALAERLRAGLVFCGAKPSRYRALLNGVKRKGLRVPVVVVSRLPEVSEWLDALDAGAMDYCAAPFERRQIRWLLDSAALAYQRV